MHRFKTNDHPGPWVRALIVATAALVFGLSVFSASPALHAWLHANESKAAVAFGDSSHSATTPLKDSSTSTVPADDACAVVMFAQGVLAVVATFLLSILAWRVVSWIRRWESALTLPVPRFFLPPLCGPPAS